MDKILKDLIETASRYLYSFIICTGKQTDRRINRFNNIVAGLCIHIEMIRQNLVPVNHTKVFQSSFIFIGVKSGQTD
jgi:hypothetical protein